MVRIFFTRRVNLCRCGGGAAAEAVAAAAAAVPLTKTKKKTREHKEKRIDAVRDCVDQCAPSVQALAQ